MKAMRPTLLLLLVLAAVAAVSGSAAVSPAVVATVTDGDTVRLADGRRVRLVQIDTPELNTGECYSRAARTALLRLVPERSAVGLETDPGLDQVDRYGRLLRYLRRGGANVNLELVRQGAAAPYFYGGDLGRYAHRLLSAAKAAKAARRGLWGACPGTVLDPYKAVETRAEGRDATRASFRGAAVTLRTRPCASRPTRRTSTATTCLRRASRSSAPTHTASTATATASAAKRPDDDAAVRGTLT